MLSRQTLSGWYKSTNDKYKHLKNIDVAAVNKAANKEGQSAARYIVSHFLLASKYNGCLNMKQINDLANEFVAFNKECFNKDGSFKEGFSTDNMVIPDSKWIARNILGNEAVTPGQRLKDVKDYVTGVGNWQYFANVMAQNNRRETLCKNVYYNDKTKEHFYLFDESDRDDNGKIIKIKYRVVKLPEIVAIDSKGRWKNKDGTGDIVLKRRVLQNGKYVEIKERWNSRTRLEALAEERLEETASSSSSHGNSSVPDNDGMSDNTNLFEEDEDE